MAKHAFDKFMNKPISGAKKKEAIRQEKRKAKQEIRARIDEKRRQNEERFKAVTPSTAPSSRPNKYPKQQAEQPRQQQPPVKKTYSGKTIKPVPGNQPPEQRRVPSTGPSRSGKYQDQHWGEQPQAPTGKKAYSGKPTQTAKHISPARQPIQSAPIPAQGKFTVQQAGAPGATQAKKSTSGKVTKPAKHDPLNVSPVTQQPVAGQMPLNKYIAHAGVCGRREAAELVKSGEVKVNGQVMTEPGYKVTDQDKVSVKGKTLHLQKNLVYILLNKPKDYITTVKDPEGRKTVFDILKGATQERIYPVGRLDRNTTGVLLMTNDGELAQKLTHPSFEVKKIYEVRLDKPVTKKDLESIVAGVTLDDGFIQADAASYVDPKDKSIVGIEIHSGRNRIVRRIFEHLGYDVKNLDRVMFANLTKKNVDRGKWRHLSEKEIRLLKFMNKSFVRNK